MTTNLKEELDNTKKELIKTKSEMNLIEDKLDYCQNRLLDIRNENDDLKKELRKYELIGVDKKLEEADKLKIDFLKQKHRLKITKELLDESRSEINLLNEVIQDFKELSNIDFVRNNYPKSFDLHYIKFDKYSKYKDYNDKYVDND
jgi:uncharacterized coiled-coil DUF342 family protein